MWFPVKQMAVICSFAHLQWTFYLVTSIKYLFLSVSGLITAFVTINANNCKRRTPLFRSTNTLHIFMERQWHSHSRRAFSTTAAARVTTNAIRLKIDLIAQHDVNRMCVLLLWPLRDRERWQTTNRTKRNENAKQKQLHLRSDMQTNWSVSTQLNLLETWNSIGSALSEYDISLRARAITQKHFACVFRVVIFVSLH